MYDNYSYQLNCKRLLAATECCFAMPYVLGKKMSVFNENSTILKFVENQFVEEPKFAVHTKSTAAGTELQQE